MRGKRPTQQEVAKLAGVSQAVVSQVLNNRPGAIRVTSDTRERVLAAMRELGYIPNAAAQRLAGGRNHILGVFTYEPVFPTSTRDFFYPFLEGIEEEAARLDYDLLLHTRHADANGERRIYASGTHRMRLADGTLLLGLLTDERRAEVARLLDEGHPAVFIGRRDIPGRTLVYVTADYTGATRQALQALQTAGHQRTAYIGEVARHESSVDRELGYTQGSAASGGGQVLRFEHEHINAPDVRGLLNQGVTALLFENDRVARAWLTVSAELGVIAPRDFSFTVLGNPLDDTLERPSWASFQIPRREMGHEAVRLLVQLLNGEQPDSVTLPCRWVPGLSIGPVPTHTRVERASAW